VPAVVLDAAKGPLETAVLTFQVGNRVGNRKREREREREGETG
jgi:hypothetical protein